MALIRKLAEREASSPGGTESDCRMTITRLNTGKSVSLLVAGELDSVSAGSLERSIRREELGGATDIGIDLQCTSFIDAGGIRTLVGAARRAGVGGWHFRVVNARGIVKRVFEITQLYSMIDHWQRQEAPPSRRLTGLSGFL